MATTLTRLWVHIVFSTKLRADLIPADLEEQLYAYIGGVCRNHRSPLLRIGGTANHVHLLVNLSKVLALSDLLMDVKKDSTKWVKAQGAGQFGWQDGYGGFTIGESQVEQLERYIAGQKSHHRRETLEEEYSRLLRLYRVEFDPEYVWD